jgi:hypothetical protein
MSTLCEHVSKFLKTLIGVCILNLLNHLHPFKRIEQKRDDSDVYHTEKSAGQKSILFHLGLSYLIFNIYAIIFGFTINFNSNICLI